MTHIPIITTKRLTLRGPTVRDRDTYAAYYAVTPVLVGKYRGERSVSEVQDILAEDIAHWQAKGFGMWLLEDLQSGAIVGGCGIVHPDDWPRHELTWWLMPDQRGKGYATEASIAAINFAYNVLGWSVVETHMRDENAPARALVNRLGGQKIDRLKFPDGVARDVFALPAPLKNITRASA